MSEHANLISALKSRAGAARDGSMSETAKLCAAAADLLRQDKDRIECLERWWYSVPEEQRVEIMADVAWKRHVAAGGQK